MQVAAESNAQLPTVPSSPPRADVSHTRLKLPWEQRPAPALRPHHGHGHGHGPGLGHGLLATREHRRAQLRRRVKRLVRSSAVGIVATGSDFVLLETCVRALGVPPGIAKLPALVLGSLVQFFGVRDFAFGAREQHLGRQLKWYVFAEVVGIVLTFAVFRLLVHRTHLPFEIANFTAGAVVYFGFSYPMFHKVFKKVGAAPVVPAVAAEVPAVAADENVIPISSRRTVRAAQT